MRAHINVRSEGRERPNKKKMYANKEELKKVFKLEAIEADKLSKKQFWQHCNAKHREKQMLNTQKRKRDSNEYELEEKIKNN
jgi:hypothetical protein